MAARKRKTQLTDSWKTKIQASMLLNRLIDHVNTDGGVLNSSQVRAAEVLLRKVMPDLAHTTGEMQHTVVDDLTERLMEARKNAETSRKSLN